MIISNEAFALSQIPQRRILMLPVGGFNRTGIALAEWAALSDNPQERYLDEALAVTRALSLGHNDKAAIASYAGVTQTDVGAYLGIAQRLQGTRTGEQAVHMAIRENLIDVAVRTEAISVNAEALELLDAEAQGFPQPFTPETSKLAHELMDVFAANTMCALIRRAYETGVWAHPSRVSTARRIGFRLLPHATGLFFDPNT